VRRGGVKPQFREYEGDDVEQFIVSLNIHRRHLNASQRGMIAAKLANMTQGERTDLEPFANLPKVGQMNAGRMLGVGTRTVTSGNKVLEQGTQELQDAVTRGEVPVSTAERLATLVPAEQRRIVNQGPKASRDAARDIRTVKQNHPQDDRWFRPLLTTIENIPASTSPQEFCALAVKRGHVDKLRETLPTFCSFIDACLTQVQEPMPTEHEAITTDHT
jgi:hypothetical protein